MVPVTHTHTPTLKITDTHTHTKQEAEETNTAFIWAGRPRCSHSGAGGLSDWPTALNSI